MSAERLNLLWGITMAPGHGPAGGQATSLQAVLLLVSGLVVGRAGFHWVEPWIWVPASAPWWACW